MKLTTHKKLVYNTDEFTFTALKKILRIKYTYIPFEFQLSKITLHKCIKKYYCYVAYLLNKSINKFIDFINIFI